MDGNFPVQDLTGLDKSGWTDRIMDEAQARGAADRLGRRHFAAFVKAGPVLLVSFETVQGMRSLTESARPLGWLMSQKMGWSSLLLASDGDTWFRDKDVYAYFDQLVDDGFFDDFDRVIFYGAGPCGYAAAAYSVTAPGARVLAVQPQATLDPAVAEWDDRFTDMRRLDFTSRYGFAPDMIDAAQQMHVIYDPDVTQDAMHAALFTAPNVAKYRMRYMGEALQTHLLYMKRLFPILQAVAEDRLTPRFFAGLYRARRNHLPYLRRLLSRLELKERPDLIRLLCRNVTARFQAPRFQRRLRQLDEELDGEET
ncbi:phosphoadenosine phosphosulfate reductase [Pseudooceanicola nitratireducens]|uniref:phosphoadenosine phosphosulfate reductase n=1 Tax=Pseudooceanicola nitratireducens TaxID=517719 RepID=UPI001C9737E3|nr:phosphoadenosine phosphosulfate reductase [Pseudooceanicola nitratireducens]MBY6156779.1 phosphoadenosine phosphosulfate reductase [Pseudooceanicola nitratireducens]